jgi:hypothetical protein
MVALFSALSSDELDQVLNYISYLPVPEEDLAPDPQWRNPDFQ